MLAYAIRDLELSHVPKLFHDDFGYLPQGGGVVFEDHLSNETFKQLVQLLKPAHLIQYLGGGGNVLSERENPKTGENYPPKMASYAASC